MTNIQHKNTNTYILPSILVGGCAGVGLAYLQKPYLKKGGIPTDTFRDKVMLNVISEHSDFKPVHQKYNVLYDKLDKLSNNNDIINLLSENKIKIPDNYKEKIKTASTDELKIIAETLIDTEKHYSLKQKMDVLPEFNKLFENFHDGKQKLSEETTNIIKKVKNSMMKKYALIYAGIGAVAAALIAKIFVDNK